MTTIAAIQTSSSDNVDDNLVQAEYWMRQAKSAGAQLLVLPECFALMQKDRAQLRATAETHGDGKIQRFLERVSHEYDMWVIAGSVPLASEDAQRVFNSMLVYDAGGCNVARYDKIHLFDVELGSGESFRETDYTIAGAELRVQDTPAGPVGLSICYDLRFPEMYRRLSELGARILAVPSAFTASTGEAHWEVLLRARAIENSCYVVAPAQVGVHASGRKTWGHSLIIDPWGEIMAERADEPGLLTAQIDLKRLEQIRGQLPSLSHRRPDLLP